MAVDTPSRASWRELSLKSKEIEFLDKMEELLERRLSYLWGRSDRVTIIAHRIGKAAKLGAEELATLNLGARFHDLGLLGIPGSILEARRQLTPEERRILDYHVHLGGQILNLAYYDFPEVVEIGWYHHERVDGKGPLALGKGEIPFGAQVTSVAGAIESMYWGRPYRAPMSPEQIWEELRRSAGTQFDSELIGLTDGIRTELVATMATFRREAQTQTSPGPGSPPPEAGSEQVPSPTPTSHESIPPSARVPPAASGASQGIDERLRDIAQLRALPTAVCEVLTIAGDKHSNHRALAKAIEQDIALAARVMTVANCAAYRGHRSTTTTIEDAVAQLGFEGVKQLTTGMGILRAVGGEARGTLNHVRLWGHSFACAQIASTIWPSQDREMRARHYLTGLLHDLGKFIIAEFFSESLSALAHAEHPQQEEAVLGLDHAHVGAKVLAKWHLPTEITGLVENHHFEWRDVITPAIPETELILALQVADGLAIALGFGSAFLDYLPDIPPQTLNGLAGLAKLDIAALREKLVRQMEEMRALLGLYDDHAPSTEAGTETGESPPIQIDYITDRACRLDFPALFIQHARRCEVRIQALTPAPQVNDDAPMVIRLCGSELTAPEIEQLKALLSSHRGLLIGTQESQQPSEIDLERWSLVPTPIAIGQLEAGIQRILPD